MSIRPSKAEDIAALQAVLEGTMLLLSELPPQMIGGSGQREIWITAEALGDAHIVRFDFPGALDGFCVA